MRTLTPAQAALRILTALGAVVSVSLWPRLAAVWLPLLVLPLLGISCLLGVEWAGLLKRMGVLAMFSCVVALGLVGQPEWKTRASSLVLKSCLSLWIVVLLLRVVSFNGLLAGLRRLRFPGLLLETLAFWGRYCSVLSEEWHRLQLARQARTFSASRAREFQALAGSLGTLFIRAYERAERVHQAMVARGYRGEE
jgi:cobalt/nickel transport system permease protein